MNIFVNPRKKQPLTIQRILVIIIITFGNTIVDNHVRYINTHTYIYIFCVRRRGSIFYNTLIIHIINIMSIEEV